MKTEVKNDNELIAEFMGFVKAGTFYETNGIRHEKYKSEVFGYTYPAQWAFDVKWDWLMPVVEKIYDVAPIDVLEINNESLSIFEFGGICVPISDVYSAVIEFIRWYNYQTTSNLEQS